MRKQVFIAVAGHHKNTLGGRHVEQLFRLFDLLVCLGDKVPLKRPSHQSKELVLADGMKPADINPLGAVDDEKAASVPVSRKVSHFSKKGPLRNEPSCAFSLLWVSIRKRRKAGEMADNKTKPTKLRNCYEITLPLSNV